VPAAVRAVEWATLPAARRAIDAACAVSVVTGMVNVVVLAPTTASAARAGSDATSVSVVRDGRGQIARLPSDASTTTSVPARPPAPAPTTPAPLADVMPPDEVVIATGDDLWELSAKHLARVSARARADVDDAEVAPYWALVCATNRERLASGDPNVVYPGERVVLPPLA
jgi:hypothetical protein